MNILFTDLDNTLIYSKKTDIKEKIQVEIYNEKENSFMSKFSYDLIKKLQSKLLIVPITTRTFLQYKRIDMGIKPEYALCDNGAILLKGGKVSWEWYKGTRAIIDDSYNEREKAFKYLEKDKRRTFECRDMGELFIFTKCEKAEEVCRDLKEILDTNLVDILYNKDKLYVFPKKLNKGDMVRRFIKELKNKEFDKNKDLIFAAGDTEFDIGMIEYADVGFAHEQIKNLIKNENTVKDYKGLFSDFYLSEIEKMIQRE